MRTLFFRIAFINLLALLAVNPGSALQTQRPDLPEGFISGTVQGAQGPEAGVWVIAETDELLTKFIKIVVTDDQGRFTLPQVPDANYRVWVRGYGLADSTPVQARPGEANLALRAVAA